MFLDSEPSTSLASHHLAVSFLFLIQCGVNIVFECSWVFYFFAFPFLWIIYHFYVFRIEEWVILIFSSFHIVKAFYFSVKMKNWCNILTFHFPTLQTRVYILTASINLFILTKHSSSWNVENSFLLCGPVAQYLQEHYPLISGASRSDSSQIK